MRNLALATGALVAGVVAWTTAPPRTTHLRTTTSPGICRSPGEAAVLQEIEKLKVERPEHLRVSAADAFETATFGLG